MWLKIFFILTLLLSVHCIGNLPLVQTPLGEVRGYHRISLLGRKFSAFEGLPYAKPPIGDRRFEEPEPIQPWLGIWNATFLTECAQTILTQPNSTTGQEDCLYINIYVPRSTPKPDENLNVIVHIHGGAYSYRSGHYYSRPELLMDREVIFVTFNYRLGVLGFLSTEDGVVPGNNGLKDQAMALKWVQENIASFGGNPNSVTLNGLSGGGSSVHLHYLSGKSKGLFHRGFSQSGFALNPWSIQENPLAKTTKLAEAVGCPITTTRIMVQCLKQRPYKHILDKVSLFFTYLFMPCVPFGPVVERGGSRPFLSADPYHLMKTRQVYDVPWLASTAIHDGTFPVQYFYDDLDYIDQNWENLAPGFLEFSSTLSSELWKSTARKIRRYYFADQKINKYNFNNLIQVFSDRFFFNEAETSVRLQSNVTKSPVYYFSFAYPGDNNEEKLVGHAAEAKYYFGPVVTPGPLTTDELKMKDLLLDMLVSYAKTGVPVFGKVDWKPTKEHELTYLSINGFRDEDIRLKTTKELTNRSFWKSLNFSEGENLQDESQQ